ncbi:hypothetical protein [Barnesiella viscericola]|uniref:hypothetical protein n=1 Tax=Barnesiella viscericola TaxID=397865 RepID=UPI00255B5D42|nr:hypothetical protein [Barnesiella viscericola]
MKLARTLLWVWVASLLTGCSGRDVELVSGHDGMITIALQSSGLPVSRVSLSGSDPMQHVTYVQLYVFNGIDPLTARCVASENVMWHEQTGQLAAQYYKLQTPLAGGEYTFVAVGLDNPLNGDGLPDLSSKGSATAYGLPGAIEAGDGLSTGTLLADARASLVDGGSVADVAESELMAGFATSAWNGTDDITVQLELQRRVAGVLCYVTQVPESVETIELISATPQYADVPLCKQPEGSDFGTRQLGEESRVLLSTPVTAEALAAEQVQLADGTTIAKQRGSIYVAAYLLPVPQQTNMLTVRLTFTEASGKAPVEKRVRLATDNAGGYTYDFPIQANWIYSIGRKSTEVDEPADLGGDNSDIVADGNWQADIDIPM